MINKKEIVNKINGVIKEKEEINTQIPKIQKDVSVIKENNELSLSRLKRSRLFFNALPEEYYPTQNTPWGSLIGSASGSINIEAQYTDVVHKQLSQIGSSIEALSGTATALATSSENIVRVVDFGYGFFANKVPEIKEIKNEVTDLSPIEKKARIIKKLEKIDATLSRDFNNSWENFIDKTEGWYKDVAHSMREVLSGLLHKLSPRDAIMKCDWVELDRDKNPTQKSMVKFAIIGFNKIDDTPFVNVIEEEMTNARELYCRLNGLAHFRKEDKELPKDVTPMVESELSSLQNLIEKILDLREKFFVPELVKT